MPLLLSLSVFNLFVARPLVVKTGSQNKLLIEMTSEHNERSYANGAYHFCQYPADTYN